MKLAIAVSDTVLRTSILKKFMNFLNSDQVWEVKNIEDIKQIEQQGIINLLIMDYFPGHQGTYQIIEKLIEKEIIKKFIFYIGHDFLKINSELASNGFTETGFVVLKELGVEWLAEIVKRQLKKINKPSNIPEKLLIQSAGATYVLNPQEIMFIEKIKKQLVFYTTGGKFVTHGTLTDLEKSLPYYFCRSHRSYLINLCNLRAIIPQGRSFMVKFSKIDKVALLSYDRYKKLIGIFKKEGRGEILWCD